MRIGFGPRLLSHLFSEPLAVGAGLGDDRVRLDAGVPDDLGGFLVQPLQLPLRLLGVVERLPDGILAAVERPQQRAPGELGQQRQQDQKRDDGPDEKPRIGPKKRGYPWDYFNTISSTPTSAIIATPSSRKSGRFTAPVILSAAAGWRAMPSRRSRGELPDAEAGADDDHAKTDRRAEVGHWLNAPAASFAAAAACCARTEVPTIDANAKAQAAATIALRKTPALLIAVSFRRRVSSQ